MVQDQGVAEVVRQLDQACREAGFFYVVTHCTLFMCMQQFESVSHLNDPA